MACNRLLARPEAACRGVAAVMCCCSDRVTGAGVSRVLNVQGERLNNQVKGAQFRTRDPKSDALPT